MLEHSFHVSETIADFHLRFTRGWTLQELLAPRRQRVKFFDSAAKFIGTLPDLTDLVHTATNINLEVLKGKRHIREVSVAQKMSWASGRMTTRIEDRAYSLLGIFGISMPMLYGEGEKAFQRLQEEIMKVSTDLSLFAWEYLDDDDVEETTLLAPSPGNFADCHSVVHYAQQDQKSHHMTNLGLEIELVVEDFHGVALLNCSSEDRLDWVFCLCLQPSNADGWEQAQGRSSSQPVRCEVFTSSEPRRRLRKWNFEEIYLSLIHI